MRGKDEPARGSVRMSQDEVWTFVHEAHAAILVTLRADGMPVALPVWFAALDRRIFVRTRGKKLARIRRDGRASVLVESGTSWAELKAVHFTGRAVVLDPEPDSLATAVDRELDRKYAAFRTRAEAMPLATRESYARAALRLVEFIPERHVLNWDNSRLDLGE
jgi:hypothetical protein